MGRSLGGHLRVDYLARQQFRFNEDEFLRYAYHYGAKDLRSRFHLQSGYEDGITPERVFDEFVKGACRDLRNHPTALREFVLSWCEDLAAVSQALVSLLEHISSDSAYNRLFRLQGPDASVYPLLMAAQARGFLDGEILCAISVLDLRVYQVRGTDPKADLYRYAVSEMKTGTRNAIYNTIVRYCRQFGTDQELDHILRGHVYSQSFTKYVLWQRALKDDREIDDLNYELYADCQVEHILPDDPSTFDVTTFGFESYEDYEGRKHGFGNFTVLESRLNNRTRHYPPRDKSRVYAYSRLALNRILGTRIEEAGFTRDSQAERLEDMVQFFKQQWPIPVEVS